MNPWFPMLGVAVGVIIAGAALMYHIESPHPDAQIKTALDAFWWTVATVTTVGYGDVFPITVGGKVFTFIILMLGLGIVAVPTGIISSALTKSVDKED